MSDTPRSFEDFFRTEYRRVLNGLWVAFRDRELVEDAAQEAFVRAYARWGRVQTMERPEGWVFVVAFRCALRATRRSRRPFGSAEVVPGADVEVIDRLTLRQAVERLPQRQRTASVLRYYADLSLADIATAMGCSVGTVKSTLHDARQRLGLEPELAEVDTDAR